MDNYMTAQETAQKWGVSVRQVQQLCKNGKVEGVMRVGRNWIIPVNTDKPTKKCMSSRCGGLNGTEC